MKLEQQVPSLNLCRKLKSLSYPQEGLYYWDNYYIAWNVFWKGYPIHEKCGVGDIIDEHTLWQPDETSVVAPTVAEMGEWLPASIRRKRFSCDKWPSGRWFISYRELGEEGGIMETDRIEANARAKMLIYLLENNYLKLEGK